jgi:Rap1a immunity proteins
LVSPTSRTKSWSHELRSSLPHAQNEKSPARTSRGGTVHVVGEDAAACFGYMDAVSDVLARNRMETCLPDTMVPSQLARVFVRPAQSHPQNLQLAFDAVLVAIREAFPCR